MKINTKQTIKTLQGVAMKSGDGDFTVGEALGNLLANSETGGKLKLFILAQKFANQDEVDLDDADLSLVKNIVEDTKASALVIGQLLLLLEKTNEDSK